MSSDYQLAEVPLSAIDSETETFRITTNSRIEDLVSAFQRVGLTHPPILKASIGRYLLVSGFRRIAAARRVGWETLPCRIMPEHTDLLSCALLAISENSIERSLNLIETSRALSLLESLIGEKDSLLETAARLGLPANPSLLAKLLPLCRLPESLQAGLLSGALALPSVHMLSKLSPETATTFSKFLTGLKLSLHKQREVIDIVIEISKRENCSVESVLASPDIVRILDEPNTDLPQKAGRIRRHLKERRFPSLSHAQSEFDCLKSQLKLGEHVSLSAPPGFEGNRYMLSMSFATLAELEAHQKTLGELAKHDELVHLLSSRNPHAD